MKKLLCPSMMCANFGNLENEIRKLEESGIDIFHLEPIIESLDSLQPN